MLSLYFRLIGARIRAQMQYKISFWLDLLGFAIVTTLEFVLIAIMLARFQPIAWTPAKLLLMPLTILSGATIYVGLLVIGATICFWTIKTPEVINAFTFGGEELTSYPLSIYNRWMRGVFLYLIPLGFANYPAALLLLGRSDPYGLPAWLAWLAPLAAGLFFSAALAFWRLGVSKYTS